MSGTGAHANRDRLLDVLRARFEENPHRHEGFSWDAVRERLTAGPDPLRVLAEMERTGGEPDLIGRESGTETLLFVDCVRESPEGRRSLCYDPEALASRKKHKPADSAVGVANEMGVELLTPELYRVLQRLEPVDMRTSSWLLTPPEIRERGGAIFGDRRYDTVFVYHNGAESYYAGRGFRGLLRV